MEKTVKEQEVIVEQAINEKNDEQASATEVAEPKLEATKSDFEEFLAQFPEADAETVIKGVIETGDFKKGGFTRQYVRALKAEAEKIKNECNSEEFLIKKARENKAVSEEIIRDYLKQISEDGKKVIKTVKGASPVLAPLKPKTVAEAGKLANDIFKSKY